IAVPWWNECTSGNAPRCDWSYGLTGSSIEIQGGPLAMAGLATSVLASAATVTQRRGMRMATSRFGLPMGCRPRAEGLWRGGHLASREISPLKLRAVTCAPPAPVENRRTPRSAVAAVRRFVLDPAILTRSKSATVLAGARHALDRRLAPGS